MGNWGNQCNYRYDQRIQFFTDGRHFLADHLAEDGLDSLAALLSVEANHAEVRPAIEEGRHQRAVADQLELDRVTLALMEQDGEFVLTEQARHLTGGREGAGDQPSRRYWAAWTAK